HSVCPVGHAQTPAVQVAPCAHELPHMPQLRALVCRSAQTEPPPPGPPNEHMVWPVGHMLSQTPLTHWCPRWHALPHWPQLRASVCRSLQAPGVQLTRPASHTHAPATQVAPMAHWLPHWPQLNGFVCRSTHAFEQLVRPASHETVHIESEHTCFAPHVVVQLPQWAGSLVVSVQTLLQRCSPGAQPHVPPTQKVPPRHTMPQPPQLSPSLLVSTHELPHTVWLLAHCDVHAELEHTWPGPHTVAQSPQCCGSDVSSTHAPLQFESEPGHVLEPHMPNAQVLPMPQRLRHWPQLRGSLSVSTHAPLQSVRPGGQPIMPHMPKAHIEPKPQRMPHWPQLRRSLDRSTHEPLQSVSPLGQPPMPHMPSAQVPAQTAPHLPQFCGSVATSMHAPPQSVRPRAHVAALWPFEHTCAPQSWPHEPQFFGSLAVSTQAPLHEVPVAQVDMSSVAFMSSVVSMP